MLWWSDVIMSMFEVFIDDIDLTEQKNSYISESKTFLYTY